MDWHKLQHKLFEMDPVDPRAELENLRKIAQTPTPLEEPDLLNESYAIKPGSMPLGIESISDFAALAGIRLDEKQLKGPAGQAKGSDAMPAAKPGRTKHPLKDKLVDEAGFRDNFKTGAANYNTLGAFSNVREPKNNFGNATVARSPSSTVTKSGSANTAANIDQLARVLQIRDVQRFSSAIVNASQGKSLSGTEKQILGEAFQNIILLQEAKKKEAFSQLLSLDSRSFSQPTSTLSQQTPPSPNPSPNPAPARSSKKKVTSSKQFDSSKNTIKEQLLRLLEEKKLK